ncbi:MAG: NPCBM/NEW2 domain-containing protein [Armatimonadota bacterium]|nr:NPCBM/NEW2 domain-containing protein [bacterium]
MFSRYAILVACLVLLFNPNVYGDEQVVMLENMDLSKIYNAWTGILPKAGKNINGGPMVVGGVEYKHGIGMHSETEFTVDLKGVTTRFEATFGMDTSCGTGGSATLEIWLDGENVYQTGVLSGVSAPENINIDTTGARELTVVITNGGNGLHGDFADLADAKLTLVADAKSVPEIVKLPDNLPTMKIASKTPKEPAIHGPRVVGTTPGKPFLFLIPATGEAPLLYSVVGLPDGLMLDSASGKITGSVESRGTYVVELTVTNQLASNKRKLTIVADPGHLALTPPMGWNSWNAKGLSISDQKIREIADAMVSSGLAAHGYQYVNIDAGWGKSRDENGELSPNEKFPNMKALGDYIHDKGLKFGIYSSPGPSTCGQCPDGSPEPGSYQHEAQDAGTFAKWGVDYLKYDMCSLGNMLAGKGRNEYIKAYRIMTDALADCDRDIVYSLCEQGVNQSWEWGASINGQLWRDTHDIFDLWASMTGIGFSQNNRTSYSTPGHWNDLDMLVVGKVGWGPTPRPTTLTPNEQITHVSLWAMLSAPLLLGNDLTQMDQFEIDLLTNDDIIDVDQDPLGIPARRISNKGRLEVWAKPLWDGTMAVAFFNRSLHRANIIVNWSDIGLLTPQPVRDLWLRKYMGIFKDSYEATVPGHGATVIKIGRGVQ